MNVELIVDLAIFTAGAGIGAAIASAITAQRERINMALEADEEVRRDIAALDQLRAADTQDRSEL